MARYSYKVTNQVTNQTVNDDAGNTIVGTYVYYLTGRGNKGAVFVPDNLYSAEHVRAEVKVAAKRLDDVGALTEEYDR